MIGSWTFDRGQGPRSYDGSFDEYLRSQLPWYELMLGGLRVIAAHHLMRDTAALDLGASTGSISCLIADFLRERNVEMINVEPEPTMLDQWRGNGTIIRDTLHGVVHDSRHSDVAPLDSSEPRLSLLTAVLSLSFAPPAERAADFRRLLENVMPGGVAIVVDKVAQDNVADALQHRMMTICAKLDAGADPAGTLVKELQIAGSQVPLGDGELGDRDWRPWFRFADFVGVAWRRPLPGD